MQKEKPRFEVIPNCVFAALNRSKKPFGAKCKRAMTGSSTNGFPRSLRSQLVIYDAPGMPQIPLAKGTPRTGREQSTTENRKQKRCLTTALH